MLHKFNINTLVPGCKLSLTLLPFFSTNTVLMTSLLSLIVATCLDFPARLDNVGYACNVSYHGIFCQCREFCSTVTVSDICRSQAVKIKVNRYTFIYLLINSFTDNQIFSFFLYFNFTFIHTNIYLSFCVFNFFFYSLRFFMMQNHYI